MNILIRRKVKKICIELKKYRKLREMCDCDCQRYILTKKCLWLSTDNQDDVILCDDELANIIREYCDKKINNLERMLDYYGAKHGRLFDNWV